MLSGPIELLASLQSSLQLVSARDAWDRAFNSFKTHVDRI